jgi:hypothetical protein
MLDEIGFCFYSVVLLLGVFINPMLHGDPFMDIFYYLI